MSLYVNINLLSIYVQEIVIYIAMYLIANYSEKKM